MKLNPSILKTSLLIAMTAILASCSETQTTTTPTAAKPESTTVKTVDPSKKLKLAFVTNNTSDFWKIAEAGTKKAVAEIPNIEVLFKRNPDNTAAEQTRLVDDLLSIGIDGLAISPVDPKNQTQLLNKAAAQGLVVTQDSDAEGSNRACYIGTDNVAAGRMAGKLIKEAIPQGGKIMLFVGTLDAANARERKQGIEEEIKGTNITIVDTRTDGTGREKARANVSDALVANPDLVALVGLWSYNGPAILNAVKAANKVGKIKIIAFDEEDETLAGIKAGEIFATVVQQPFEFGFKSIELLAKVIRGDKSVIPASKKIVIDTLAIKKEEVEEFSAKLKKQLGK
jgi:ribose transport system substrate-binding protein